MPTHRLLQGEPRIRRADARDVPDIARLFWTVRAEAVPAIPTIAQPRAALEGFVRDVLLAEFEVWLAETDEERVGFMALMPPDQLGHLYVAAGHRDHGLGSRFLTLAQERYPEGLQLWTFRSNPRARQLYERHGFVAVECTEDDHEEGAPDVRMVWPAPEAGTTS